jgi:hypothetical protein
MIGSPAASLREFIICLVWLIRLLILFCLGAGRIAGCIQNAVVGIFKGLPLPMRISAAVSVAMHLRKLSA